VRAFQPGLCLPIHFYTGWQFFLFLLFPLRLGYDWRGQRCGRFPNANSNGDSNCHSNRYRNGYSDSHRNGYCNCDRDRNADARTQWQIFADTETTSDTSASPVGPCISSDR